MWFIVLWDHWQKSFKNLVCHQSTVSAELKPSLAFEKQYIWDDSSDDDQPKSCGDSRQHLRRRIEIQPHLAFSNMTADTLWKVQTQNQNKNLNTD